MSAKRIIFSDFQVLEVITYWISFSVSTDVIGSAKWSLSTQKVWIHLPRNSWSESHRCCHRVMWDRRWRITAFGIQALRKPRYTAHCLWSCLYPLLSPNPPAFHLPHFSFLLDMRLWPPSFLTLHSTVVCISGLIIQF